MRQRRRVCGRCATSSIWPTRRSRSWRTDPGGTAVSDAQLYDVPRPARRSTRWSASSMSCGARDQTQARIRANSKARRTPVRRPQLQRPLPTTLQACRTGPGSLGADRTRARGHALHHHARGRRTSHRAEHERRIAEIEALRARDGSNVQQVDQLIAQSAAVRDAQLKVSPRESPTGVDRSRRPLPPAVWLSPARSSLIYLGRLVLPGVVVLELGGAQIAEG